MAALRFSSAVFQIYSGSGIGSRLIFHRSAIKLDIVLILFFGSIDTLYI